MIRRPPRSTLFPTRRSSDLPERGIGAGVEPLGRLGHGSVRRRPEKCREYRRGIRGKTRGTQRKYGRLRDRKSTRLNSSHVRISYAVFCLKKKKAAAIGVGF